MEGRRPGPWDHVAYLLVLPMVIAGWMTALGIRPQAEIGTWLSFVYVAIRVLAAWWAAHAGALAAARLLRPWRPRLWVVMLAGFLLIWLPVTVLFHYELRLFEALLPQLVGRIDHPPVALSAEYLGFFLMRSAVPFLPLWMAVAHAYRKQFGVDWYTPWSAPPLAAAASPGAGAALRAGPALLANSRLPPGSCISTLKAAEHYIEVVADSGKDLVRHRFNDAVEELAALGLGCQVHRSWWVSWASIAAIEPSGRALELVLKDGRRIPVSLTYKNGFLAQYRRHRRDASG